ncbi:MAG: linear amide C-N hydrolase [Neisseriaceae bacterium]|nr:MAG: linear amide C-N hydrolase [Neisseriaceae bacterium]
MCTELMIQSKNKEVVVARTMDFASATGQKYGLFNAGEKIANPFDETIASSVTVPFKAKFSDIGFTVLGKHFGARTISDGFNQAGLSLATLWLADTSFDTSVKCPSDCISGLTLPQLILGTCKTVDDVKALFKGKRVNLPSEFISNFATIHLSITEKSGKQVVVEFETVDGKDGVPVFYENTVGVLTNAPKFAWHLTNLRNYVGATEKFNIESGKILGAKVKTTGFGNNQRGLLADGTPPSRFALTTILKSLALDYTIPSNAHESMVLADKIISKATVIIGTSANHGTTSPDYDYTQWTVLKDLTNFKMYQKSDTDLNYVELECKPLKLECNNEEVIALFA